MQDTPDAKRIQALTTAIEGSFDGIVIANPDHTVAFANPAWLAMHGFAPDDSVAGRPLRIFHSDVQMKRDVQPFLRELASRGSHQARIAHLRRDGTSFEAWTLGTVLPQAGHEPAGYVKIARPCRADETTEADLRRAHAFLESIVDNIPDMIFVKDAEGRFVLINRAGEELVGRSRSEMFGKSDYDLFPRGEAEFFTDKDREALRSDQTLEIPEEPIHTRLKGVRWLHTKKMRLTDEQGARYLLGIAEDVTEHRKSHLALRASEERFRLLVDGISDHAIFLVDRRAHVQTWSSGAMRIFGYPATTIVGQPIGVFTRGPDDPLLAELLSEAAAKGRVEQEGPCYRFDGSCFWGIVGITSLGTDGAQFAMVTRDQTEQRRATERQRVLAQTSQAMATSLDFETTLAEATSAVVPALADACVVYVVDPSGPHPVIASAHTSALRKRVLRRIARAFRTTREPDARSDLLSTDYPVLFPEVTSDLLARLAPTPRDLRLLHAIGARSAMLVPLFARGRKLGLLALWYDVSDHRYDVSDLDFAEKLARRAAYDIDNARLHTELEHAERGQRLLGDASKLVVESLDPGSNMLANLARLVVTHLADGCFVDIIEDDGEVVRAALAFASPDLETKAPTFTGKRPVSDVLTPTADAIRKGEPQLVTDVKSRRSTSLGSGDLDIRAKALFSSVLAVPLVARGRTLGALTLLSTTNRTFHPRDVSVAATLASRVALAADNSRLLTRTEEALHARDEFLSIASHELRTPLTALQLQIQSMQRMIAREQWDGRVGDKLGSAARQIVKLGRLVDGVLDVSHIVGGRLQLQPEQTDLAEAVLEVVGRFREEALSHGCELRAHIEVHPRGKWDPLRLDQIATNIIANAIKYAPNLPVDITVRRNATMAVFSVRDYGIGIPPESLERIFGRFERAVSARSYGGMGLGLYITRQLVDAHGGTIRVTSHHGAGAEFIVELPLSPQLQENAPPETTAR